MLRLLDAFANSARAFKRLATQEAAFRQELAVLALALPVGWFVATGLGHYALLIGVLVLVLIVEVLNTGLEAACNAVTRELHPEIGFAKDCGSLAVLMAIGSAGAVWAHAALAAFG